MLAGQQNITLPNRCNHSPYLDKPFNQVPLPVFSGFSLADSPCMLRHHIQVNHIISLLISSNHFLCPQKSLSTLQSYVNIIFICLLITCYSEPESHNQK